MSTEQFHRIFSEDSTAWLDRNDDVFYVEEVHPEPEGGEIATSTTSVPVGSVDQAAAFSLHSRPEASRKIYLDFDGHVTIGTSWNNTYGSVITSLAFDKDGNNTSWSDLELAMIYGIWARVSEDFAPFNVDVTTQDPGVEGLKKSSSTDTAHGIRVVISPTNFYGSAGGVAYLNSFSSATDTPAFAFTANVGNSEKNIAEVSSHEAGHAVGLSHDGTSGTTYYKGHGDWAPIMGNSYYEAITQWSRGEFAGATNTQDDLTVMQKHVPAMADEVGNTPAAAAPLTTPVFASGLIGTATDRDVFRLDVGAGTLDIKADPSSTSPNLDLKVRLLDASGTELSVIDGPLTAGGRITTTVNAGTYYLEVDGIGYGDPATTGYSDYASIGRYVLSGTFPAPSGVAPPPPPPPPPPSSPPTASITASATTITAGQSITFSGAASSDPDGGSIVGYAWTFAGTSPTTGSAASEPRTFTTAGTYNASLTVTDDEGQTASSSVTVTVNPAPTPTATKTGSVTGVRVRTGSTAKAVVADITVLDQDGKPIVGAVVTGQWSGQAKGKASATTASTGVGSTPDLLLRKTGQVTFTVTGVKMPAGYTWDGVKLAGGARL